MAPEKESVVRVTCLRSAHLRRWHARDAWPWEKRAFPEASRVSSIVQKIRFVDETDNVEALYDEDESKPMTLQVTRVSSTKFSDNYFRPSTKIATSSGWPQNKVKAENPAGLSERPLAALPPRSQLGLHRSADSGERITFPLQNPLEARLMRYYLDYMCTWFDLCDSSRHFGLEVPKRAMSCPMLLNAIFAISSRHLSMNEEFDDISSNPSALENDNLLAAIILLRTLEELDVPLLGEDYEGHLLGIQVFMNAPDSSMVVSEMRKAAFWVGLRQEVTMAFASQRAIRISLGHNFIDQSFTEADDDTWANRIIVHCANVIEFCFGDSDQKAGDYQTLKEYDDGWLHSRPPSFLPLAFTPADLQSGEPFPRIVYLNHAVVIGVVHAALARALLMCYDPKLPKIGPARKAAQRSREDEVRDEVRQLCGIALSNRGTIPAMFTASLGIASFGDTFGCDIERKALLDILVKTDVEHYWPTAEAQTTLKKAWAWA
ncbi:Fc.00g045790.m01.CDS01 [Cosmosporella sp. VM-42]